MSEQKEQKGFGLDAVANYQVHGAKAQQGFDPDGAANQYRKPSPGRHRVKLLGGEQTRFLQDVDCKWSGQGYCLHQIWPKFEIVEGKDKGATIMDFVHIPTWDAQAKTFRPMALGQENRWGNFARALGVPVTQDDLWPDGFFLPQLGGRECYIHVVPKLDRDTKQPLIGSDGQPDVQIKMFGYEPLTSGAGTAPVPQPVGVGTVAAPAPDADFQL